MELPGSTLKTADRVVQTDVKLKNQPERIDSFLALGKKGMTPLAKNTLYCGPAWKRLAAHDLHCLSPEG